MKNYKKIIAVLCVLMCLCVSMFFACSNDSEDEAETASLTLTKTSITLEIGESQEVDYIAENIYNSVVTFESQDESIAEVGIKSGIITAKKKGQTTIKVKVKDIEKTLTVIVTNNSLIPVIQTEFDKIEIVKGGDFTIVSKVLVNGQEVDTTVNYAINDTGIATISNGVVTGADFGETYLTINASYDGNDATPKIIPIKVNHNVSAEFNVSEVNLATGSVTDDDNVNEVELTLSVKVDDAVKNDLTITWLVDDEDVATVVKNGSNDYKATVKSKDVGTTTVYARFSYDENDYACSTELTCYIPYYNQEGNILLEKNTETNSTFKLPLNISVSDIDKIQKGNNDIIVESVNEGDNSITIKQNVFAIGENELKIEAEKTGYIVNVVYANKIIKNKTDFENFAINYENNKNGELYVLDADIDMQGENITNMTNSTMNITPSWVATFDGMGHAIKNIAFTHGLFATMGAGTVKNLALINASKPNNGGGFISNTSSGTISNCYIQGFISTRHTAGQVDYDKAGVVAVPYSACKIENCVVQVEYLNTLKTDKYYGLTARSSGDQVGTASNYTLTNNAVISNTATDLFFVESTYSSNNKLYSSTSDMLEEFKYNLDGKGPWKVVEDKLYFGLMMLLGNQPFDVDLTNKTELPEICDADNVDSVYIGSAQVAFEKTGNVISITPNSDLASNTRNTDVILTVNMKDKSSILCTVKLYDLIIKNKNDLTTYANGYGSKYSKSTSYIILANDIDATDITLTGMSGIYSYHTFDGRGYSISNLAIGDGGLMGVGTYGTLKNIALINCSVTNATEGLGNGLIAGYVFDVGTNTGKVENVYIMNPTFTAAGQAITSCSGISNSQTLGLFTNVIIKAQFTGGRALIDANYAYGAGGTLTNVYGITNTTAYTTTGSNTPTTLNNCGLYADVAALKAGEKALTALDGQGPWKVENGILYFGTILIG